MALPKRRPHVAASLLAAGLLVMVGPARASVVETGLVRVRRAAAGVLDVRLRARDTAWTARVVVPSGPAVFADVPPGEYELAVEGAGGLGPLVVRATEIIDVEVETAGMRVVRRAPLVWSTSFDSEALRSLPSGRDAFSLVETVEPTAVVDRMDTGGIWTAEAGRLTSFGGSWTETSFTLFGLDHTDPWRGGRPLVLPHAASLCSFDLLSAAAPVETAGSGAALVFVPRRPSRRWTALAEAATAVGGVSSIPDPPPVARLASWRNADVMASGPLGERAGVVLAAAVRSSERYDARRGFSPSSRLLSALAHFVWEPAEGRELRLIGLAQDAERPPEPLGFSGAAEDRRHALLAAWESRGPRGGLWRVTGGWTRARSDEQVPTLRSRGVEQGEAPATSPGISEGWTMERLTQGSVAEQVTARGGSSQRAEAGFHWALPPGGGLHLPRLGATLGRTVTTPAPFTSLVGETVGGVAARAWAYTSGLPRWSSSEAAAWVADRVLAGPVHLDGGLRVDSVRARAREGDALTFVTLSPRVSARWSIFGERLSAWGAWSRLPHRVLHEWLAWGDPEAPRAEVFRWRDLDADGRPSQGERRPLVARRGPGAPHGTRDPDLARPYTDELLLALESRLGPARLRFAGIDRRGRRLVESVNEGLTEAAYRARLLPDPAGDLVGPGDDQILPLYERVGGALDDFLVLTNPPDHHTRYQAVVFLMALEGERARLWLGATAHRSEGLAANRGFLSSENDPGLIGELFDEPNADTFAIGDPPARLFFDRAYTIKLSGQWRAPGGVRLAAAARYQDGQPFARLVVENDLTQGPDFTRAVPNGRHRFEFALTVDARAEKSMEAGRARISVALEAFNLLQNRHEVDEDVVTGPAFRTPTLAQPPRVVRAGLRVEF